MTRYTSIRVDVLRRSVREHVARFLTPTCHTDTLAPAFPLHRISKMSREVSETVEELSYPMPYRTFLSGRIRAGTAHAFLMLKGVQIGKEAP